MLIILRESAWWTKLTYLFVRYAKAVYFIILLAHEQDNQNSWIHALALEYIKVSDDNKAREIFETILTEYPDYVGSYYHLGKLLERLGENQLAIEWYEKGMSAAKEAKDNHACNELQAAYEDLVY